MVKDSLAQCLTFNTGLDFSAIDFRSSMPALTATEMRVEGAGAKAAADPIKRESRESFMVKLCVSCYCYWIGECIDDVGCRNYRGCCFVFVDVSSHKLNMISLSAFK